MAQPTARVLVVGTPATFTLSPFAPVVSALQWQRLQAGASVWNNLGNGPAYGGVTSGTLTVLTPTPAMSGDRFRCLVTGTFGVLPSSTCTLALPPVLNLPAGLSVLATGTAGAPVPLTATATDSIDGTLPVHYLPTPGSLLPIGTTTVTCTATNSLGFATSGTFPVTVLVSYASFLDQYGIPGADPLAVANSAGLPNLLAYALGMNPRQPDPTRLPRATAATSGSPAITYFRRVNAGDLLYRVEVSSDLVNWNSGPAFTKVISVTPVDSMWQQVTEQDLIGQGSNPRRFIRLNIVR